MVAIFLACAMVIFWLPIFFFISSPKNCSSLLEVWKVWYQHTSLKMQTKVFNKTLYITLSTSLMD